MMQFKIPKNVEYILEQIHKSGEEAYIVGGCVRDIIMDMEPEDYDITTSAQPEHIKRLFRKTIDTGLEHGTVTVLIDGVGYEVTTYRIEGKYEDYRRPTEVVFTRSLDEDLLRRDFTINAMAYNPIEGIIDLYGGQEDIQKKVLRCVGHPEDRFNEDALRMLRAIRFSAKLDFDIEMATYEAMKKYAYLIEYVSAERIYTEITKTLLSKEPWRIEELANCGLIQHILSEYILHLEDPSIYEALMRVPPALHLRWAIYLSGILSAYQHHPNQSKIIAEILKALRFDNKTSEKVKMLITQEKMTISVDKLSVRRHASLLTPPMLYDLLCYKEAKGLILPKEHERIRELLDTIVQDQDCLSIKDLDISGKDLIGMGINQGQRIGQVLEELLEYVLTYPKNNQKDILIKYVQKIMK